MKTVSLATPVVLLFAAALLVGRLWIQRLTLTYNEEWRYFDTAKASFTTMARFSPMLFWQACSRWRLW